jgi:hypothetical protein
MRNKEMQHQDEETVVPVRQVAKQIVAIENDVSLEQATGDPYHNVYTSLIQTHLPKLNDVGAIDYNSERKYISPERNLVALAIVASLSSPVVQMLFHTAISHSSPTGMPEVEDSTNDC